MLVPNHCKLTIYIVANLLFIMIFIIAQVQNRIKARVAKEKGSTTRRPMGNQGVSLSRLILCELGWEVNADCLSGSRDLGYENMLPGFPR